MTSLDALSGAQVFVIFLLGMLLGAAMVDRVWAPVRKALHAHAVRRELPSALAGIPDATRGREVDRRGVDRKARRAVPLVRVQIHRCGGLPFCPCCRRN